MSDPTQHGESKCRKNSFIRHEVGRRNPYAFISSMNGFDEKQGAGFVGVGRTTGQELTQHASVRVGLWQDQRRQFTCSPEPVFGK